MSICHTQEGGGCCRDQRSVEAHSVGSGTKLHTLVKLVAHTFFFQLLFLTFWCSKGKLWHIVFMTHLVWHIVGCDTLWYMVSSVLWLNFGNGKILWVSIILCIIVHCGLCYISSLLLYKYKYKWHTHLPQFGKQLGFCGTQRVTNPVWPIPNPPRRRFSTFLTFPPSFRPFSTSLMKSYFP